MRSAITVAGMVGTSRSSSLIRGSTASTIDPFAGPLVLGWVLGCQGPFHGVLGEAHPSGDGLGRHLL